MSVTLDPTDDAVDTAVGLTDEILCVSSGNRSMIIGEAVLLALLDPGEKGVVGKELEFGNVSMLYCSLMRAEKSEWADDDRRSD